MKKTLYQIFILLMGSSAAVFSQDRTISGQVTDAEDGQGIPGLQFLNCSPVKVL